MCPGSEKANHTAVGTNPISLADVVAQANQLNQGVLALIAG